MARIVVGLFDTLGEARDVVQELVDTGFSHNNISLVANAARGEYANYRADGAGDTEPTGGATTGAVSGGVLGLLAGVGALAIPSIGPVLAAGPLAAALASAGAGAMIGAGTGTAAGGLLGGLIGTGIPEEDAEYFSEGVRRGSTLVVVQASDDQAQLASDIMNRHNVIDIDQRVEEWRRSGWSSFDWHAERSEALERIEQIKAAPRQDQEQVNAQIETVYRDDAQRVDEVRLAEQEAVQRARQEVEAARLQAVQRYNQEATLRYNQEAVQRVDEVRRAELEAVRQADEISCRVLEQERRLDERLRLEHEQLQQTEEHLHLEQVQARQQASTRYVNSWFEGHPEPSTPLQFGEVYKLGIQVSPTLRVGTFTKGRLKFNEPEFAMQEMLDVVVGIVTDDFEVLDKPAKRMVLPKDKNQNSSTVTFNVRPVNNNDSVSITVLFYHENNLFHEARIGARVEVLESQENSVTTAYFPTESKFEASPRGRRDLSLQAIEVEDGYRLILFYDFGGDQFEVFWCKIPVSREKIANLLRGIHDDIVAVVKMRGTLHDGKVGDIFYDGESPAVPLDEKRLPKLFKVDDVIYAHALQSLAKAGRKLYVTLFYPSTGSQEERTKAAQMGEILRRLSGTGPLKIQVLSDDFFIPWNLLYDGDYRAKQKVNVDELWGCKHIIEEIPYRTLTNENEFLIPVEDFVSVGMNINRTISSEPIVSQALTVPQLAFVQGLEPTVHVTQRLTEEDVLKALEEQGEGCQVEYFYCHAGTEGDVQKDFDQSYLGLTSHNTGLTLEDIKLATVGHQFRGNPLFLLNACESVQLDGRFYDGFVPKFLAMGACAVVGTDCVVPSLFAAHFGTAFLKALFQGSSMGEALLTLRKQFLEQYQNPLGLIYRAFGNVDVRLSKQVRGV